MNIFGFINADFFGLDPESYSIAIHLFIRLLGGLYVIVYIPFLFQMRGLYGEDGIRPIASYLNIMRDRLGKWSYYYLPTVFWLNASDAMLLGLVWSGIILGALLALGVCPPLILLLLYIVHLSLSSAGQDFMSFGWESFLMEITFAAMIMTATTPFNVYGWVSLNFLLLRFHLQAGASKFLSRDKNWRNLTAIAYHYLTQPLPNTVAWYFHKFPLWVHKISTLLMHYIELVVPFFIFAPPLVRLVVFVHLFGLQFVIWLTGNLSYLNHLTVLLCLLLINNVYLAPLMGPFPTGEPSSFAWETLVSVVGVCFLALQIINMLTTVLPLKQFYMILSRVSPFHLSVPHGIFAVMTTKRYEIIIEGSDDGENWKEYGYYFKPGDLAWRPRRISPYQPRIDWQTWFLPFGRFATEWWFQQFLIKLLQGSKVVTKLLKHNPFGDKPPTFVRALIYDYEFTTFKEKKETGHWWKRKLVGFYAPSIRLRVEDS